MEKWKKVVKWLDILSAYSLYAMVFVLPFSVSLIEIFFLLMLIFWIARKLTFRSPSSSMINPLRQSVTDLNLPIYVFVFVGFLSVLFGMSFFVSLRGFFIKLLKWIALYFMTVEIINSRQKLNRLLMIMLISVFLATLNGILQYFIGVDLIYRQPGGGCISGAFASQNGFAGWLVVMIPVVISISCLAGDVWNDLPHKHSFLTKALKAAIWVLAGLMVTCLVLTYCRAAWLAFIMTLLFLGILKGRRSFIIIIVVLLIAIFIVPNSVKERAISVADIAKMDRVSLWKEAVAIIKNFPILGCGFNTYAIVGPYYKIFEAGGVYPHNSYLHLAAETGLLGLGTFLWIIVTLFIKSLANLNKAKNSYYGTLLIGLLGGLFGFLVHSFFDTNIYAFQLSILMWFIMGLIMAVQKIALKSEGEG